jgi:aminopeptidase-like protein
VRKEKLVGSLRVGDCIFWGADNEEICVIISLYKCHNSFITDAIKVRIVSLYNNLEYVFILSPRTRLHIVT